MESEKKLLCRCAACGKEAACTTVSLIREDKQKQVEDMSLFRFRCPACGHVMKLLYPCLYWNEEKKILVWFLDQQNIEQWKEMVSKQTQEQMLGACKRYCHTLEEFAEKVRILESGLEDRAIELLKMVTFARVHMQQPKLQAIYFYQINQDGAIEFILYEGDDTNGIEVPAATYQEMCHIVAEELPALDHEFCCIDLEWAGGQIMQMQE
ncbi:MAG: CpXC domain-containing protein [Clostridium sp.]